MTPKYKIFYTDRTTLLWSDVAENGDPALIPDGTNVGTGPNKRIGVHSIIQEFQGGIMREVLEQYHYIFSRRDEQWIGVGLDGLLDVLVNDLDDIRCVLHGRTITTDRFWDIKQTAREDMDIVGGNSMADEPPTLGSTDMFAMYHLRDPYYTNSNRFYTQDLIFWNENGRHRMYDPRVSEAPRIGDERGREFYH